MVGRARSQFFSQLQFTVSLRNENYNPKRFVLTIQSVDRHLNRQYLKLIVRTIPFSRPSYESLVWAIPVKRHCPKSIGRTVPVKGKIPNSIVETIPIGGQSPKSVAPTLETNCAYWLFCFLCCFKLLTYEHTGNVTGALFSPQTLKKHVLYICQHWLTSCVETCLVVRRVVHCAWWIGLVRSGS